MLQNERRRPGPASGSAAKGSTQRIAHPNRPRLTTQQLLDWVTDVDGIVYAAKAMLPRLLSRWLPHGRLSGWEWEAGQIRVALRTGRWIDAEGGIAGSDPLSLYQHMRGIGRCAAAREVARHLDAVGWPMRALSVKRQVDCT